MIEWYEHDDEHTIHHVHYRMPGENYYGFSPPEDPDPIGWCEWCENEVYNEDYIVDGDVICPDCWEYWNSNNIAVDFIVKFFGSMPELAKQCREDDWMEFFADYMRECEPDKLKQVVKNEDTALPCDAPKED